MLVTSSRHVALLSAFALSLTSQATALWDCSADQHVFAYDSTKFLVHTTNLVDSHLDNSPWIRICIPGKDGYWKNVEPIELGCSEHGDTYHPDKTNLKANLHVVGGQACHGQSLYGASITYKGKSINLEYGGDDCGPRDHGITCEFSL